MTQTAETASKTRIKTANQWLRSAREKPVPRMLFGEFWLEGELAIMFAGTGLGKSVLGVQIADAIARGTAVEPFDAAAAAQKVLYIDLEMSEKQFEMRYTRGQESGETGRLSGHYRFSDRFKRAEIDAGAIAREGLAAEIGELVRASNARVVIIDDLALLRRTANGAGDAIGTMLELRRVQRKYGLSILVLAHSPGTRAVRPLAGADLPNARVIAGFADSIFAIGQNMSDRSVRYIKHIKHRSTESVYDEDNLPTYRMAKLGENFLGFRFMGFCTEDQHLNGERTGPDWALIDQIKEMSDRGMTIRAVAAKLELTKTRTHRLLHMWEPPPAPPGPPPPPERYFGEHSDDHSEKMGGRRAFQEFHELRQRRAEESRQIEIQRSGPPIVETDEPLRDKYDITDEEATEMLMKQFEDRPGEEEFGELPPEGSVPDWGENNVPLEDADLPSESPPGPVNLKRALDGYGKEIFIESETERGEPKVWYKRNRQGSLHQYTRESSGIVIRKVEEACEVKGKKLKVKS